MNTPLVKENLRILVVDDTPAIHQDFQKILAGRARPSETDQAASGLFGEAPLTPRATRFELGFAAQGQEGLAQVEQAVRAGQPYAMAFVDVRMPPGWDGVETIAKIWRVQPDLEIVLCTAYSDYSWDEMSERLGCSDRLVILKKPFDNIEVLQLATALTEKWRLRQQANCRQADLEARVEERTGALRAANATTEQANQRLKLEMAERRQAEATALRWQQRYDLIALASGQVVYEQDRSSGTVIWSGSVEKVLGQSAGKLRQGAGAWAGLIHEDDRTEAMRLLANAELEESDCERIYRFNCGNGAYRWIHDRSFMLKPGPGQSACRLGVMEDISARRQAEQRIREQAALLNKTRDAILVCDLDYCISYWNRGAEQLYGWSEAEALRAKVPDLLHRQTPRPFREACAATIATGIWSGELAPGCKDGRSVTVESRWTLLRNPDGAPMSLLMVSTDVTERKQLEARFLRAQRLESIGNLASGIAHDLNNIFTPIMMSAQMLHDEVGRPSAEPLFDILQTSAKRGASMVRQVLTFARGADGERCTLQMRPLLEEVEGFVRDTFPRSIELQTSLADALHHVRGNATQLHQVLMNLCVNARDAMAAGGRLTITAQNLLIDEAFARAQPHARTGPHVEIAITDTGTGMSAAILDHVFEPFFTTKETGKGTGLGLSTALGIVKSHGGFIDVASAPGQGTCMRIYLPAATGAPHGGSNLPLDSDAPKGHGECILVVDDESTIREIMRAALAAHGYEVCVAADGTEAVAVFAADPDRIQLVITDMMMPYMDGHAVIRALRHLRPSVPLIAVSGVMGDRSYDPSSVPSTVTFLLKPYTVDKLLTTVRTVLAKSLQD